MAQPRIKVSTPLKPEPLDVSAMTEREKQEVIHRLLTGYLDSLTQEYAVSAWSVIGVLEWTKRDLMEQWDEDNN